MKDNDNQPIQLMEKHWDPPRQLVNEAYVGARRLQQVSRKHAHLETAPQRFAIRTVTILGRPRAIFADIENRLVLGLLENRTKRPVAGC
ncbi:MULTISPECIES: hypothetical protein [Bradyrhizobium]|uniref:hypothetical protein n=1 Tax=Bradyrhizobium TaxID=374 RepID=UPI001FD8D3F5|nr:MULTISPECIES: hypothetical protein [Bradyrhizobium]MDA9424971.1 hypothetical protein [Bradyrhizobium sp. CCBAU 53380]